MVSFAKARSLALSFNDVVELPHFDRTSFRKNNKIFATLSEKEKLLMVKLSLIDQSVFCDMNKLMIYPVSGGWGKQGATYIDLKGVRLNVLKDALKCAYDGIIEKK